MKFDLSGKNCCCLRRSSGIGKAIAETLKIQGAEVFIIDLNENLYKKLESYFYSGHHSSKQTQYCVKLNTK